MEDKLGTHYFVKFCKTMKQEIVHLADEKTGLLEMKDMNRFLNVVNKNRYLFEHFESWKKTENQ